jgi:hypothetical protein
LDIFGRTGGHGRRRPVQCWVALVRLPANEAVEVLEAAAGRQTVERPGRFGVVLQPGAAVAVSVMLPNPTE